MTIKIASYTFAFPDEADVLENCLNSLARCVDHIYLIDGGMNHAFVHRIRNSGSLWNWLLERHETDMVGDGVRESFWKWNNVPLTFINHEYVDPGSQRNFALEYINSLPEKYDWIVALDADEVESGEAEAQMRDYLESLPIQVTNVVQPLLNLVQDEQHCADGHHSTWLVHSRLHRPNAVHYNVGYHEHQTFEGIRVQWNPRIIHTRMLFRKRIWDQRGAHTLRSAWDDVKMVDVPPGITWHPLRWPDSEIRIPFDEDIRNYEAARAH